MKNEADFQRQAHSFRSFVLKKYDFENQKKSTIRNARSFLPYKTLIIK